jgi:hypothetical protein
MNKILENLIDDIVLIVDEDIFNDYFNKKTARSDVDVESERDRLRDILEPYLDDSEFLTALKRAGIEYTDEYEEAVKLYGKPIYE